MTAIVLAGTDAGNGGAGLQRLVHARGSGWRIGDVFAPARNASFGVYSGRHDLYYFVDEQADGALGVYRAEPGGWQSMTRVATQGAGPCHVALDPAQDRIAIAHYGSGSIALFELEDRTGLPIGPPQIRQNSGSGPVAHRQAGPHAHCVCFSPDRRWLYQVDLGTDQILGFSIDPATGALGARTVAFHAPEGSGPRHLFWHPALPFAVLASELASTLTILAVGDGVLRPVHRLSTLPADFAGANIVGHLAIGHGGDRIYVTNRGHDSVAVFDWQAGGMPILLQHRASGGPSPRAFVLLEEEGQFLLANEQGGNVTVFPVLPDGTLGLQSQDIRVPGAVFLLAAGRPDHGRTG